MSMLENCLWCNGVGLDQYSGSMSPEVWALCIGNPRRRTDVYRDFITNMLKSNRCHTVLDAACGTGVDSVMLLEEGFHVTSIDLSYKMLKFARDTRWERRKEHAFDLWEIKEANWLCLKEDLKEEDPFDAVVCIGNSFPNLIDSSSEQSLHKKALTNLAAMVKPGGLLIIDHLNYDNCMEERRLSPSNFYYTGQGVKVVKTSMHLEDSRLCALGRIYEVDTKGLPEDEAKKYKKYDGKRWQTKLYPHQLVDFQRLLKEAFGPSAKYQVFGDYKPISQADNPGVFIHVVQKNQ